MSFTLPVYQPPDFAALGLGDAPDVKLVPAERDGVVPEQYHATTMFPEYFRLNGRWVLRYAGMGPSPLWSSAM